MMSKNPIIILRTFAFVLFAPLSFAAKGVGPARPPKTPLTEQGSSPQRQSARASRIGERLLQHGGTGFPSARGELGEGGEKPANNASASPFHEAPSNNAVVEWAARRTDFLFNEIANGARTEQGLNEQEKALLSKVEESPADASLHEQLNQIRESRRLTQARRALHRAEIEGIAKLSGTTSVSGGQSEASLLELLGIPSEAGSRLRLDTPESIYQFHALMTTTHEIYRLSSKIKMLKAERRRMSQGSKKPSGSSPTIRLHQELLRSQLTQQALFRRALEENVEPSMPPAR